MQSFHIPRSDIHYGWNNALQPAVTVDPGAVVELEVANASGDQLNHDSTTGEVTGLDFSRVNPVTGPVNVRGAEPGDALIVDILAIDLDDWGWTANIPGFGLLADRFDQPYLAISRLAGKVAEFMRGLRIPIVPFIGTIGVAPAEPGQHSVVPPRRVGGNMDIRQMTPGARLWLPIEVEGALLSLGDTHAAQGDGEVCGTAIEVSSQVTLRVQLAKGRNLASPMLETHPISGRQGRALVTTGIGPDLMEGAREATLCMIEELGRRYSLAELDAYLLCSVAGDLKISEVVDMPNWVVSMHIEKDILDGAIR